MVVEWPLGTLRFLHEIRMKLNMIACENETGLSICVKILSMSTYRCFNHSKSAILGFNLQQSVLDFLNSTG